MHVRCVSDTTEDGEMFRCAYYDVADQSVTCICSGVRVTACRGVVTAVARGLEHSMVHQTNQ